jgi:NTE family protein
MLEIRRKRLEAEIQAVRDAGGEVELIVSDDASAQAFGINLMDARRRGPAAEAGYAQGKKEAKRLAGFWG